MYFCKEKVRVKCWESQRISNGTGNVMKSEERMHENWFFLQFIFSRVLMAVTGWGSTSRYMRLEHTSITLSICCSSVGISYARAIIVCLASWHNAEEQLVLPFGVQVPWSSNFVMISNSWQAPELDRAPISQCKSYGGPLVDCHIRYSVWPNMGSYASCIPQPHSSHVILIAIVSLRNAARTLVSTSTRWPQRTFENMSKVWHKGCPRYRHKRQDAGHWSLKKCFLSSWVESVTEHSKENKQHISNIWVKKQRR